MDDLDVWLRLVLAVLAAWRLTHLVAYEDGPWDVLVRIRRWLGNGFWGKLMDCFDCLSVWIAAPLSFFVTNGPVNILVTWLAISGATCLLERAMAEPVVIQPTANGQDQDNNDEKMLRLKKGADKNSLSGAAGPTDPGPVG